jgi:hypothetical protein
MGTGISKAGLAVAALTLGLAGCGAGGTSPFAWLHAQAPPSGWRAAAIPSGAVMTFPPRWRREPGDSGTATAALLAADGRFLGYLNLTPRQGSETLANWSSFRIEHNAEEGDRDVKLLASAQGLHFLSGRGACVKDSYTTQVGTRYVEIACLVVGARASSVMVGAAPPDVWPRVSGTLERAIEAVKT